MQWDFKIEFCVLAFFSLKWKEKSLIPEDDNDSSNTINNSKGGIIFSPSPQSMQDLQANVESVDETIDRYLGVGDIDSAVYWMDSGLKRLLLLWFMIMLRFRIRTPVWGEQERTGNRALSLCSGRICSNILPDVIKWKLENPQLHNFSNSENIICEEFIAFLLSLFYHHHSIPLPSILFR